MADISDYNKYKKKKQTFDEYLQEKYGEGGESDVAPVTAPTAKKNDRKWYEGWFEKGAFEDGYQFGDISKTIGATTKDLETNVMAGVLGMGETAVDTGAYLIGGLGSLFNKDFGDRMKAFIETDLYDAEAVARKIVTARDPIAWVAGENFAEENSLLGERADSLAQSGGQLLGAAALQTAYVPWFVTMGVTSFGGEVENAFNQGANYGQAGLSGAISAAAEILTEKISGGINFGAGTLDDVLTKQLATGISNKLGRTLLKFGIDVVGEGGEEVISQFASNLGSALYREENLGDILFNEEAVDGYLESFIGGAVLGGGSNVVNGINSSAQHRDATSGMTANEEKVFKKVYDARLAEEAEKKGRKLKLSEKNKIYDEVMNDLEKGYIGTDTIEEVLGGKTYESYKSAIAEEDALKKEFAELGKMKKSDFTAEQDDRYTELKQKLAEMKEADQIGQLRSQLTDEVQKGFMLEKNGKTRLIDTHLAESYNERARRGQAFEADLSKYNEKQQATVKKAIESGILNNTNRTHELVDTIARISADKGVLFDFTNNKRLKESGFAIDGVDVNGFVTKDGVTLNIDSHKAWQSTVGHEITHVLEGTEHYKALRNALFEYAKNKGDYQSRYDALTKLYKGVKDANVEAELTSDLVGDYLFTDEDFVRHLSAQNRNVFQKIYDEIKYLLKIATTGSKEARELERIKHTFEKVYRESGKANTKTDGEATNTKYSLNEFEDGQRFVSIESDQKLFDGLSVKQQTDLATKIIKERFQGKVIGIENKAFVNGKTADEYTHPVKHLDADTYEAKMRASTELDNLMDAGFNYRNEADGKYGHTHSDAIGGFDYFDVIFKVGSEYFQGTINIKNINRGKLLKDITKIKNITQDVTSRYGDTPSYAFLRDVSMDIIPQNSKKSSGSAKFSLSDSDGKQLTKEQSEYFKDSKIRDENGNLLVMYHGTKKGGFTVFSNKRRPNTEGFYFTNSKEYSDTFEGKDGSGKYYDSVQEGIDNGYYTPETYEVYLNVKNPFVLTADQQDIIEDIGYWENIYKPIKNAGYDGVMMEDMSQVFVFNSNQIKSVANAKPTGDADIRYSLSSIASSFYGDENMSASEFARRDYTQTKGYKDYVKSCVNNMRQTRADFDEVSARREVKDAIDGIVRVALAAKRSGYDIYDDATKRGTKDSKSRLLFSSLEPNSDYFTSSDISTICDKRKNFAEIYDDIVRAEEAKGVPKGKRFFDNVDNYFYLHKLMADKGLTQPCRQCYVESMRKNLAPMANAFLRLVGETNPNNTANDQLYEQKGKKKGELKTNNAATREWVRERLAEYGMTAEGLTVEMLTTEDGLAQLKIQAPMIYEAFNSFYGQSKPKMPKSATPFRFGELTALLTDHNGKIKQNLVNRINSTGGFRLQSYSDFQIQNYTDVLQTIFEAGTLGLNGHAYTKVPAFLDATDGTNLKRNISIFMYKDGNEWKLDRNDSFPYTLEEIYDIVNSDESGNTSIIAVSQNNEMSAWIMANDLVGYGIPFHKSGLKMGVVRDTIVKENGREIKGYTGTKDHTKQQTEVWARTEGDHKAFTKVKKGINIYSFWDFNNAEGLSKNELIEKNVKEYINRCEEAGYIPKFRDYVMNNGKVLNDVLRYSKELGFVSPDATIEDISFQYKGYTIPYGYYKFLGDFGMFAPDGNASPQQALSLRNYDFAKAEAFFADSETLRRNEILQQFANGEERQRYRDSDLTSEQLAEIVKQKRSEIAQSVVDRQNSLSFEGEVPVQYGNYSTPLSDLRLEAPMGEVAPVQEGVAGNATTTPTVSEAEQVAPVGGVPRKVYEKRVSEMFGELKGLSAGKYHKVGDYGFYLSRNNADESANITINTPDGKKLRRRINGGNFWKNSRLWREAAKMVADSEYPIVEQTTNPEEVTGKVAGAVPYYQEKEPEKTGLVDRIKKATMKARTHLVDAYSAVEDLALKTGNRELYAKANFMRSAERRAQYFIGNGADGVRSINDLRKEVEDSGHYQEFMDYMIDMHNTDRMSLEEKAKPVIDALGEKFKGLRIDQIKAIAAKEIGETTTKKTAQSIQDARAYLKAIGTRNKPVRGDNYTASISRANAKRLEDAYPQFKQWAKEYCGITDYLREKLVEDGELSREAADLMAEMYPHYVPLRRLDKNGAAISVPLDTKKTGVNAPIKGATGGDGTIGDIFKTLAMRAEQTFKAGARNRFGLELKNTLGAESTRTKEDIEDMFDGVEGAEERLKKGENGGKPTFTVFENGQRVEFEIPEEIYDALKPSNELFTGTSKVLNSATKFQRAVLTEYNPFFMMRNAGKDLQDVLTNSQHPKETYAAIPTAVKELFNYAKGEKADFAKEYLSSGGDDLTYFNERKGVFDSKEGTWAQKDEALWKRALGFVPKKFSEASNFVERVPRLAEFIASRKAGASVEGAMLDAANVTTNFAAGGDVTKWANRNGATFLNASVQGTAQQIRNIREAKAKGLKGMMTLAAKYAIAGLPFVLINALIWDDDEEYEQLSDYVKENYYIVAKYGDGNFVRIPKGRALAVIQNGFEQIGNLITGNDEVDLERFGQLLIENLAPNNPLEDNVFAPILDVFDNKTWYGDDLVPTRLQDLPASEQFDETTDSISKWLGEASGTSPYKWNYLLDQYSGVFGDMLLPALTPQAEGGYDSIVGKTLAPLKDQFTTDSVLKNQSVSDFYDTVDKLTANAKSSYATEDDILKYKYINSVNSDLSDLYKLKREVQNSDLDDAEKFELVRELQKIIDDLAREALDSYDIVHYQNGYAIIGDRKYKKNKKGEWQKVSE